MSLKRLMTHTDTDKYLRWLASHPTEWLEAFLAQLERHPDYYYDWGVKVRIGHVKDVLRDREFAAEDAAPKEETA